MVVYSIFILNTDRIVVRRVQLGAALETTRNTWPDIIFQVPAGAFLGMGPSYAPERVIITLKTTIFG